MSRSLSPSVSCTFPTSLPSFANTFQPGSTTSQDFGSGSDNLAADVPDRALRRDRPGVGEGAEDAHLAGDLPLVDALEAAADHLRRRAVAEPARDAEPEARGAAETSGVDGRQRECCGIEVVARGELDLGVDVTPVVRQLLDRLIPLLDERLLRGLGRRRRRLPCRQEREHSGDALLVE